MKIKDQAINKRNKKYDIHDNNKKQKNRTRNK